MTATPLPAPAGNRNNRNYRQLRATLALEVEQVVSALALAGVTVSADRVRRWGRRDDAGSGRFTPMSDAEFDAFVDGASRWCYLERQRAKTHE